MNLFIKLLLLIFVIAYSFFLIPDGKLSPFSLLPFLILPTVLRKIKFKITPTLEFLYLIFVFFDLFLGGVVGFMNQVPYFDKAVHFYFGIAASFVAVYILLICNQYKTAILPFSALFIVSFTLGLGAFWEILEYAYDLLFNMDAQQVLVSGIHDTMQDLIVAFMGSILISLAYTWEHSCNHHWIIKHFIKEVENYE